MPRYRALGPVFVRTLKVAGEEFESDLQPGRNWEPLDDEAKAAVEKYRASQGKVLSIYNKIDPPTRDNGGVEIQQDWRALSGPKRRGLAKRLGAQANVTEADANSYIEAELERRSQKTSAA